jgi:Ca2+-transporting ATPase
VARLLSETQYEKSPLQKKILKMIQRFAWIAGGLILALFFIEWARSQKALESLIVALTFGMAVAPEEFPIVFSLYLTMSSWRLSKLGMLVKSLPSVETLGSVDVICTDKTGTLTEGRFQMTELISYGDSGDRGFIWLASLMACEENVTDAIEKAIIERARHENANLKMPGELGWALRWDRPFDQTTKTMQHIWINERTGGGILVMKGATEGVIDHCRISTGDLKALDEQITTLAGRGQRLLGLACSEFTVIDESPPAAVNLNFIGLLVFEDPIRNSAIDAVRKCEQAGIEIKMLTGDHPLTAHSVADRIGISHSHDGLYLGQQLAEMNPQDRQNAYIEGSIFSRVTPQQKFEMVQTLKNSGRVVAMTGDGINDAPALKLADIGISMGASATDAARSSAKMLLLKNDFAGLAEAVFEGRRTFTNLGRSFSYLISFHIPLIFLSIVPPLLNWGEIFLPIHIVLLELIVHPISALTFENLPTRTQNKNRVLISNRRVGESALSGLLLSGFSMLAFRWFMNASDLETARGMALSVLIFGNVFLIFVESWPTRHRRLLLTALSLIALQILMNVSPMILHLLHTQTISITKMLVAVAFAFIASLPTWLLRRNQID